MTDDRNTGSEPLGDNEFDDQTDGELDSRLLSDGALWRQLNPPNSELDALLPEEFGRAPAEQEQSSGGASSRPQGRSQPWYRARAPWLVAASVILVAAAVTVPLAMSRSDRLATAPTTPSDQTRPSSPSTASTGGTSANPNAHSVGPTGAPSPSESPTGPACPASIAVGSGDVPRKPTVDTKGRLVPARTPTSVLICRYGPLNNLGLPTSGRLVAQARLGGDLSRVAHDLGSAKPIPLRARSDPAIRRACTDIGGPEIDYLMAVGYPDGVVWVTTAEEPNRCVNASNGAQTADGSFDHLIGGALTSKTWGGGSRPSVSSAPGCAGGNWTSGVRWADTVIGQGVLTGRAATIRGIPHLEMRLTVTQAGREPRTGTRTVWVAGGTADGVGLEDRGGRTAAWAPDGSMIAQYSSDEQGRTIISPMPVIDGQVAFGITWCTDQPGLPGTQRRVEYVHQGPDGPVTLSKKATLVPLGAVVTAIGGALAAELSAPPNSSSTAETSTPQVTTPPVPATTPDRPAVLEVPAAGHPTRVRIELAMVESSGGKTVVCPDYSVALSGASEGGTATADAAPPAGRPACRGAIPVTGVDVARLDKVSASSGFAALEGTYDGQMLTVTQQSAAVRPDPQAELRFDPTACPAPAGGWQQGYQRVTDGATALHAILDKNPERYGDLAIGYAGSVTVPPTDSANPSGDLEALTAVLVIGVVGDAADRSAALATIRASYQGNLCLVRSPHSKPAVEAQQTTILKRAGGGDSWQRLGITMIAEPQDPIGVPWSEIDVVAYTPEIAALLAGIDGPAIRVHAWMTPIG